MNCPTPLSLSPSPSRSSSMSYADHGGSRLLGDLSREQRMPAGVDFDYEIDGIYIGRLAYEGRGTFKYYSRAIKPAR